MLHFLLLLGLYVGASIAATRALFIGNSYIYFNGGVEHMYEQLMNLHGVDSTHAQAIALPNYRLRQHVHDGVLSKAGDDWSHVILQEQSQTPGLPEDDSERQASTEAFCTLAVAACTAGSSCIILLQTWGRRDGDKEYPELYGSFDAMQRRLTNGYFAMTDEVRRALDAVGISAEVRIAPAGEAFGAVRGLDEALFHSLYHSDGAHPSIAGTYLTACVLAGCLHPELQLTDLGSYLPDGLSERDATRLRQVAHETLTRRPET